MSKNIKTCHFGVEGNQFTVFWFCFDSKIAEITRFQLTAKDLSKALQSEIYRYAKNNLAKVNIYIKDPYVAKYVTEEKITEIAFVGT